jgi:hypothetical protein
MLTTYTSGNQPFNYTISLIPNSIGIIVSHLDYDNQLPYSIVKSNYLNMKGFHSKGASNSAHKSNNVILYLNQIIKITFSGYVSNIFNKISNKWQLT